MRTSACLMLLWAASCSPSGSANCVTNPDVCTASQVCNVQTATCQAAPAGPSWSKDPSSGTLATSDINGVWGSSEKDVWAAGVGGLLLHYTGSAWAADPAWQRLLDFLDGHPRSVWLVSRHFDGPRASLAKVVDRLERARAQAVVDPALIGRQDAHALLSDADAQRMRSLVASIDFSFDVLAERHPQAAAAFLQLAAFPGGVPESVAIASLAADIDAIAVCPASHLSRASPSK